MLPLPCVLPAVITDTWAFVLQWANAATVMFLFLAPHNQQLEAVVYAMADGPLAGALIVWQSSWVFSSASHSIRCRLHWSLCPPAVREAQHRLPASELPSM